MRIGHKKWLIPMSALLFIIIVSFTLCLKSGGEPGIIAPREVAENLILWARLSFAKLFKLPLYLEREALIEQHPYYLMTVARFKNTVLTFLSGAILSLAGAVYQGVFRNPMAAPTMLGVTSGVNLGLLMLVLTFSTEVYFMTAQRYIYCYGFALVMLLLAMLGGKMIGRNRAAVTDMLLVGMVLTQMVNVIISYYRFVMDELDIEIMMELTMRGFSSNTSISFSTISFYVMLITTIIGILPVHLMRFSFCAVSFSDEEALSMGVNPRVMRTISILGVTLLVASAIIHCGNVGILALVVPHVCRYWVGAKFKPLYYAGIFFGGLVLVLCRAISSLIYIEGFGSFPLGPLVTLTAMPILAMALMQRRRGWE